MNVTHKWRVMQLTLPNLPQLVYEVPVYCKFTHIFPLVSMTRMFFNTFLTHISLHEHITSFGTPNPILVILTHLIIVLTFIWMIYSGKLRTSGGKIKQHFLVSNMISATWKIKHFEMGKSIEDAMENRMSEKIFSKEETW